MTEDRQTRIANILAQLRRIPAGEGRVVNGHMVACIDRRVAFGLDIDTVYLVDTWGKTAVSETMAAEACLRPGHHWDAIPKLNTSLKGPQLVQRKG